MQYHIQTLVKHLFDKDSFEQVTVQELKQFTDDYPYAAVGQFLYAKKLKDTSAYNQYEQGEQASMYFNNALWLRWLLNKKEEAPATTRQEEPVQQPGFRIVVQMPKTASIPPVQEEEKKEEPVEEPVTTAAIETPDETPAATSEAVIATPEATSAVAIAESSQLAEENIAEAAVNAVSITEEALAATQPTTPAETTEAVDAVATTETVVTEEPVVEQPAVEAEQPVIMEPPVIEKWATETPVAQTGEPVVAAGTATTEAAAVQQEEMIPAELLAAEEQEPLPDITTHIEAVEGVPPHQPVAEAEQPVAEVSQQVATSPSTGGGQGEVEQPVVEVKQPVAIETEQQVAEVDQPAAISPSTGGGRGEASQETVHQHMTPASQEMKASIDLGEPIFESYHTIDYFASQGIKLLQEDFKDKLGKQLKSFTEWLRSMKRIGPIETSTSLDEITNQSIQRIAEHSVEEKEVLTEAMAEVWVKQGHTHKAIQVYEKLSLLNPSKSPYFAGRIEQLKAL